MKLDFPSRSLLAAALAAALAICHFGTQAASQAPVAAENGMVVTAQHLATRVGVDVLKDGGNAVDAAVAVGYALAVVYPAAGNLGGGGFMTIQLADGRTTFLDFREKAPLAATADMYLDKDGNVVQGLSTNRRSGTHSTAWCCAITAARFIVPYLFNASSMPETVPGTPTARWLHEGNGPE